MFSIDSQPYKIIHQGEDFAATVKKKRFARRVYPADNFPVLGKDILPDIFRRQQGTGLEAQIISKAQDTISILKASNKIDYDIFIPEEYTSVIIPKLLLQPIIENSIYHGMERKRGKGHLSITCLPVKNNLHISITDDGIGMTEEQLTALRGFIYNDQGEVTKNFALRTLNKELILKYGRDYGLRIDSSYSNGTTVVVSIPIPLSA
jgi:LytS/YehU family sensor histidine kinase